MSQQLRQLKSRIRSVEGTWKVTRAMEMVSMAKFKSVVVALTMARAYFRKLETLFTHLFAAGVDETHAYFKTRSKGAIGVVVITADTGLCGIYTDAVLRQADKVIAEHKGEDIKVYVYGRKGQAHFRKNGIPVHKFFPGAHGRVQTMFHRDILDAVIADYDQQLLKEVHVCYTVFKTPVKHEPTAEKFLNFEFKKQGGNENFAIESGARGILADIVPVYLSHRLRLMMLESLVSEHSARMVSMKSAKDNAKELMGDLVLLRNKMRQAMITKEVIEIISSAEALKG